MLGINSLKTSKILLPINQNMAWHEQIERIPGVIRFDKETFAYLALVLEKFDIEDSYLSCPAYHAFTGRHGLWGYAQGKSFLLFARHPNDAHKIIIYPQFGNSYPNLGLDLLKKLSHLNFDYLFVRCPEDRAAFMAASLNKLSQSYFFKSETETILDWTFPVYTISTKNVVEAKGRKFRPFRYDLYQVEADKVRTEIIDPNSDMKDILDVISFWASKRDDAEEIISAYSFLLDIMKNPCLNMSGLKFYKDNKIIAFEVWSILKGNKRIANNLAGMNVNEDENLKGFSSFQYHAVCKALLEQGIEEVCIGGSETPGLDHFKRKMNPIKSLRLKSITVTPISHIKEKIA